MFFVFVWEVLSILVFGYLHFHYPWMEDWRPHTFGEFVLFLTVAFAWAVSPVFAMFLCDVRCRRRKRRWQN